MSITQITVGTTPEAQPGGKPAVPQVLVGTGTPSDAPRTIAPTPTVIVEPPKRDRPWNAFELLVGLAIFLLAALAGAHFGRNANLAVLACSILSGGILSIFRKTRAAGRPLVMPFVLTAASEVVSPFAVGAVILPLAVVRARRERLAADKLRSPSTATSASGQDASFGLLIYRSILILLIVALTSHALWSIGPANMKWVWQNYLNSR